MTFRQYISSKFQTFGIQLSEADLLDISFDAKIWLDDEIENPGPIQVAMARFIPSLLLRANSISESGFSMSWDTKGIKDYYSFLCKKYGLKDELNDNKPKITLL